MPAQDTRHPVRRCEMENLNAASCQADTAMKHHHMHLEMLVMMECIVGEHLFRIIMIGHVTLGMLLT
jgi:hypothetical protein